MPGFAALKADFLAALASCQVRATAEARLNDCLPAVWTRTPLFIFVAANLDVFADGLERLFLDYCFLFLSYVCDDVVQLLY